MSENYDLVSLLNNSALEVETAQNTISGLVRKNDSLQESLSDLAFRLDNVGWVPSAGWDDDAGLDLDALKRVSGILRDMVGSHPLIKRADQLRGDYTFGQGMEYTAKNSGDLPPKVTQVIENSYNAKAVFSPDAWSELETAVLTDGNLFLLWDKKTKLYTRVPLTQITGVVTDPDSAERIWFIQRTWTVYQGSNKASVRVMWYPMADYSGKPRITIEGKPVSKDAHMHIKFGKRLTGHTFGIPHGFAAITWAISYSEFLKDNLGLVKAYSRIAYKVSTSTAKGGANVATKVSMPGETAGVAIMGANQELTAMPRGGSDVNFDNARAVAAMIATSFGVSVVALTADPGAAGSSYGSAQTLDVPTIIGMTSVQKSWRSFFQEIFKNHSSRENTIDVEFPAIESDQVYRQIQSLAQAHSQGGLHRQEFRDKLLELLDIKNPEAGLPEPDVFNIGGQKEGSSDPVPRQGNSGAVGSINQGTNNDDRNDTISK